MIRAGLLLLLWLTLAPAARSAELLTTDLSTRAIAVTSAFSGAGIVLFGSREGLGDIIVVVRGPPNDATVRRKHHVLGFWINTEQRTFAAVPAYYAVAASRPLDDLLPAAVLRERQIGLGNLLPEPMGRGRAGPEREADFRAALIRNQERVGRYPPAIGPVATLGAHLFRATIVFPAAIPLGDYTVETDLVRDGKVVASDTVPLSVTEAGVGAGVADFARLQPLSYGVIAVLAAALTGYLLGLPFRNR
jgi:uncharacterized protein (TIGR02186 family)